MNLQAKKRLNASRYPKSTTLLKITQKVDKKLSECIDLLSIDKDSVKLSAEDEAFRIRLIASLGQTLYRD